MLSDLQNRIVWKEINFCVAFKEKKVWRIRINWEVLPNRFNTKAEAEEYTKVLWKEYKNKKK